MHTVPGQLLLTGGHGRGIRTNFMHREPWCHAEPDWLKNLDT